MVLSLRNREKVHTKKNANLKPEKLSREETRNFVKNGEVCGVILKETDGMSTRKMPGKNEVPCVKNSTQRRILADKTNNSDTEPQVDDFKIKTVNNTPTSVSKTIVAAKEVSNVGSNIRKSPRNHNTELGLKQQNCQGDDFKIKTVNNTPTSVSKTIVAAKEVRNVGSNVRKSPRNHTNTELGLKQQNCIYSHQAGSKRESLKLSEKYAVYEFEVDENDSTEKKRKGQKRKRKIPAHKKLGCTVEEEIRAKNKMQRLNKLKTCRPNKGKGVKLTKPKDKGETFGKHMNIEPKEKNDIEGNEGKRKNSGEQNYQKSLATPFEQEHLNSFSESSSWLPGYRREMSPEIFNTSQVGFATSTAEKCTNFKRLPGETVEVQQREHVLQNTLQIPSVEFTSPKHGVKKKSKIPRELLSLFNPAQEFRYDDITEESDMPSPICVRNVTKISKKLHQTNACSPKTMCKSKAHNDSVETVSQIHNPDSNLLKVNSSNSGTCSPKRTEDFNISNFFGFDDDEEIKLPNVAHTKLDVAPSNQGKCVEVLPCPFRANIVIPRRPLYPRINCKSSSKVGDQKQDAVVGDCNVSIFDLEDVECSAESTDTDAGPTCAVREEKNTPLKSSLSCESPKCYSVPKRLRPVRIKPIIEESENEEEEEGEPTLKRHKRSHKTAAHDKELNKWATSFNSMCEEVDSFELCVE